MPKSPTSVWLPRVLFESALITISILLALGLDEWREVRQDAATIEQAMSNFLSEVRQNKSRVDDAAPFSRGLRNVLDRRNTEGSIHNISDFIDIVESYNPVVLQSTAWDTALATGSLAKMEYQLVAALSLTYGLQSRYSQVSRVSMLDLTASRDLSGDQLDLAVHNSVRYLEAVSAMEIELGTIYEEAQAVIRKAWMKMNKKADPEAADIWAEDAAHP